MRYRQNKGLLRSGSRGADNGAHDRRRSETRLLRHRLMRDAEFELKSKRQEKDGFGAYVPGNLIWRWLSIHVGKPWPVVQAYVERKVSVLSPALIKDVRYGLTRRVQFLQGDIDTLLRSRPFWNGFYVQDGILRLHNGLPQPPIPAPETKKVISPYERFENLDGIWFRIFSIPDIRHDHLGAVQVEWGDVMRKQMSRAELQKARLSNVVPDAPAKPGQAAARAFG